MTEHFTNTSVFLCSWVILRSIQHLSHEAQNDWGHYSKNQVNLIVTLNVSVNVLSLLHQNMMLLPLHVLHQLLHILCLLPLHILCRHQHVLCQPLHVRCPPILSLVKLYKAQQWKPEHNQSYLLLMKKKVSKYIILIVRRQGSLQLGGHGSPPNHFEILPNQKVTKFISLLYIIIRVMWLAPKVILLNHVDNKLFVIITKPSIMLERTLFVE